LVATGTINGITATSATINGPITITKTSDIVIDTLVGYSFTFITSHQIPINGILKIDIPSDILIDLTNLPGNCYITKNNGSASVADCPGIYDNITKKY
jgi:hypothetical protein